MIRSCTFEKASRRQLNGFKRELKRKLNSFFVTKATNYNAVKTERLLQSAKFGRNFDELKKTDLNSLQKCSKCDSSRARYSKNSLMGIRYGIARYLEQDWFKNYARWSVLFGQWSIFRCNYANEKAWKAKVNHHPEKTQTGLSKLYNSFDITQPKDLL